MTHTAIIEIKPELKSFTNSRYGPDYISRRMRGIAGHYYSDLLLLYAKKENTWYRIDKKTGELSEFGQPVPGEIPINELHRAWTTSAKSVWSHKYERKRRPIATTLLGAANLVEELLKGPSKTKRKTYRKRRKNSGWF